MDNTNDVWKKHSSTSYKHGLVQLRTYNNNNREDDERWQEHENSARRLERHRLATHPCFSYTCSSHMLAYAPVYMHKKVEKVQSDKEGAAEDEVEEEDRDDKEISTPILTVKDRNTEVALANAMSRTGRDSYAIQRIG